MARGARAPEPSAGTNMETLYRVPFLVLECPNLKLKKPPWVHMPSAMTVYALVVVSYFLITGGNGLVGAREELGHGEPALAAARPFRRFSVPGKASLCSPTFWRVEKSSAVQSINGPKVYLPSRPVLYLERTCVLIPVAFFSSSLLV